MASNLLSEFSLAGKNASHFEAGDLPVYFTRQAAQGLTTQPARPSLNPTVENIQ